MQITRRSILSLVGATSLSSGLAGLAQAENSVPSAAYKDPNSPFGPRSLGSPNAPVKAIEYFSLTCTHCAHFANVTMPQVEPNLIKPGKLEIIYKDYPLDQVALMAAQVARSLPAEEYYPFISALFASQDDWAFTPGINYTESIYKYAALAGMSRTDYETALHDDALQAFILQGQQEAQQMYGVNSTPTFIINGTLCPGALEYPDFAAKIAQAAASAQG
jgi:protein-disulfide isomerase